eukprot:CAMPEP_0178996992 /NCGR_PEP_ID=MMETSP0795-20121207/8681_1 /TAXON_ID=88552 /ORGANISM="Amoebophrya sp., Strain Ameob2" /LENGTH=662 /DNA_ID=CAMNT_0020689453 /DNA_START=115 /DNA_END=2103 /DNA_ORIENTATION=-
MSAPPAPPVTGGTPAGPSSPRTTTASASSAPAKPVPCICALGTGEVVHILGFSAARREHIDDFERIIQRAARDFYALKAGVTDVRVCHPMPGKVVFVLTFLGLAELETFQQGPEKCLRAALHRLTTNNGRNVPAMYNKCVERYGATSAGGGTAPAPAFELCGLVEQDDGVVVPGAKAKENGVANGNASGTATGGEMFCDEVVVSASTAGGRSKQEGSAPSVPNGGRTTSTTGANKTASPQMKSKAFSPRQRVGSPEAQAQAAKTSSGAVQSQSQRDKEKPPRPSVPPASASATTDATSDAASSTSADVHLERQATGSVMAGKGKYFAGPDPSGAPGDEDGAADEGDLVRNRSRTLSSEGQQLSVSKFGGASPRFEHEGGLMDGIDNYFVEITGSLMPATHSMRSLLEVFKENIKGAHYQGHNVKEIAEECKRWFPRKSEYMKYVTWDLVDPSKYTRNMIYGNDNFDCLLMCWPPGCKSSIHCHDRSSCWVVAVEGEVVEVQYQMPKFDRRFYETEAKDPTNAVGRCAPLKKLTETMIGFDAVRVGYANNEIGVHRIENRTDLPAYTMHVYAPGLRKIKVFQETGEVKVVVMTAAVPVVDEESSLSVGEDDGGAAAGVGDYANGNLAPGTRSPDSGRPQARVKSLENIVDFEKWNAEVGKRCA